MSSPGRQSPPSQPVGIASSPRRDELLREALEADANAQAALAAYLNPGGISPPPNIPRRVASFSSANRQGLSSSPALGSFGASGSAGGSAGGRTGFPSERSGASSPAPHPDLGIPGSSRETPVRGRTPVPTDIEALTDEEKARVLRRHLVSREVRTESSTPRASTPAELQPGGRPNLGNAVHFPSDESALVEDDSGAPTPHAADEDPEFPIPYSTPGGDITYA